MQNYLEVSQKLGGTILGVPIIRIIVSWGTPPFRETTMSACLESQFQGEATTLERKPFYSLAHRKFDESVGSFQ